MKRICVMGVLSFALTFRAPAGQTAEQQRTPAPSSGQPAASLSSHREDLFTFATKMINPKNTDFGELIAQRRAALADASVTNSYFWYSAGSTATVLFLLFVLYVKLMSHNTYQWEVAEVIADLRNAEKLATAKARQAIAGYNRHMVQCNRVVEAEIAGRVLPGAVLNQDAQRTTETIRQKLDASEAETRQLAEQLKIKEALVEDLTHRIEALENADPAAPQPAARPEKSDPGLLALVNRLTRELDSEKRRNGALKGA